MQDVVGLYCKFTKESFSDFFKNRLRFDRIMAMSLWPRFFGLPCIWHAAEKWTTRTRHD